MFLETTITERKRGWIEVICGSMFSGKTEELIRRLKRSQYAKQKIEIADADTYFDTRIDSANWFGSTDEIKEQALVTATQLVDDHAWIGSAVSSSQALAWPRKNAIYIDDRLGLQVTIAQNEIPSRVKTAVYEQALHLVTSLLLSVRLMEPTEILSKV